MPTQTVKDHIIKEIKVLEQNVNLLLNGREWNNDQQTRDSIKDMLSEEVRKFFSAGIEAGFFIDTVVGDLNVDPLVKFATESGRSFIDLDCLVSSQYIEETRLENFVNRAMEISAIRHIQPRIVVGPPSQYALVTRR